MTLISEHVEPDTRERILVVAERLFREIGYQKTTVADIAKVLRMSPANVYRFFDSKKAIHEGVARTLMGGVEDAAQAIAAGLVDEYQLFVVPAVVGGGTRALPDQVRLNLALAAEHRFGSGTVYLCYRPA